MKEPTWWPTLRAIFVAFHLVAITISALPTPEGGMNRSQWRDPTVQAEFAAWAGRLHMEKKDFEDGIWSFALGWLDIYHVLMKPIAPYERLVGSGQNWKMFVAPHKFPTSMEISVLPEGGDWQVLYSERERTADWKSSLFDHERLRSAVFRWGWPAYSAPWSNGCIALARLAFEDRPDATSVRCRFWKAPSPSPEQALAGDDPSGRWVNVRVVQRGPEPLKAERLPDDPDPAQAPK